MIEVRYIKDPKLYVPKAWGEEVILENNSYCFKILRFRKGGKFSMHYHSNKKETWYINKGKFILTFIDTREADRLITNLVPGDIITIDPDTPHQLEAIEEGEIFEASTSHSDNDSFRIEKGDSQK